MKRKSIGGRIGLALAAIVVGLFMGVILQRLGFDTSDLAGKIYITVIDFGVMGYLIYRWLIK